MGTFLIILLALTSFVAGFFFGIREACKTEGTLEPIPIKKVRKPAGPFTRTYPVQIDGDCIRHN